MSDASAQTTIPAEQITAVILAGGKARRMNGEDKGLLPIAGQPMVSWVMALIKPQVGGLLLNANRNQPAYEALGATVVSDELADFQGPLAGMAAGMQAAATDYVAFIACDSPLLPADIIQRLAHALIAHDADIAVAHDGHRLQPVCALLKRNLLPSLLLTLTGGERKVDHWYALHHAVEADLSDAPDAFINANTPEQLADIEQRLQARATPC
jgi:molybdopterin-guanine dinucleotide biosynthesis protein A